MKDRFDIYMYGGKLYAIRCTNIISSMVVGIPLSDGKPYIAYVYAIRRKDFNRKDEHFRFRHWLKTHTYVTEDKIIKGLFPVKQEDDKVMCIVKEKEIEYDFDNDVVITDMEMTE